MKKKRNQKAKKKVYWMQWPIFLTEKQYRKRVRADKELNKLIDEVFDEIGRT